MTSAELKEARNLLGLSVDHMAERLHLAKGTYLKYEYGQRAIPDDLEWRIVLSQQSLEDLALLILEQTREYGWTEEMERDLGHQIIELIHFSRRVKDHNQAPA